MTTYTIRDVADMCGVTPQAVHKYIKSHNLDSEEHGCVKVNGIFQLSSTVVETLKAHYLHVSTTVDNQPSTVVSTVDNEVDNQISELIKELRKQLAVKDEQIAALSRALESAQQTAQALSAAEALEAAQEAKPVLMPDAREEAAEPPRKRSAGFFSRLFG